MHIRGIIAAQLADKGASGLELLGMLGAVIVVAAIYVAIRRRRHSVIKRKRRR